MVKYFTCLLLFCFYIEACAAQNNQSEFRYNSFEINLKNVTYPSDSVFKWFDWNNAPEDVHKAAMNIFVRAGGKVMSFAENIDTAVNFNNSLVQVAIIDLDSNGIAGLAVFANNKSGSNNFVICEDGYLKGYRISTQLTDFKSMKPRNSATAYTISNTLFQGIKDSTIKMFSYDLEKQTFGKKFFRILPEWITYPTDKDFKWYDWNNAPDDLKKAAKYLNAENINSALANGCIVRIAAIDLDNNGIAGIADYEEGEYCCGHKGNCSFNVSENGGAWNAGYLESTGNPSPQEYALDVNRPGKNVATNKLSSKSISIFKYDTSGLNLVTKKTTIKKSISPLLIVGKWKPIAVIEDGIANEEILKKMQNSKQEMLLTSTGKCMMYAKGILKYSVDYKVQNNELILTKSGEPGGITMEIISLEKNKLQTQVKDGLQTLITTWQKQ